MNSNGIERIIQELKNRDFFKSLNTKRLIIFISGHSRSGKSTLSANLLNQLSIMGFNAQIINLDDWIISVNDRVENMNIFDIYHYDVMLNDLNHLLVTGTIQIDAYEQFSRGVNRIEKTYSIKNDSIIILDGIISLALKLDAQFDSFKIFIEVEENLRRNRIFDFYKLKGLSDNEIELLYQQRLLNEVTEIEGIKKNADIILKLDNEEMFL